MAKGRGRHKLPSPSKKAAEDLQSTPALRLMVASVEGELLVYLLSGPSILDICPSPIPLHSVCVYFCCVLHVFVVYTSMTLETSLKRCGPRKLLLFA